MTRDTTDYGVCAKTLDEKVADVMWQLERGEARIVFEVAEQRVRILPEQ